MNSYICVEGNIGAGKTTFVKKFAEVQGCSAIYEQFSQNPFLELFYKQPQKHAFPLEMSFLAERFQQLNGIFSAPDLFSQEYIADYSFLKTLIFAEVNLLPEEQTVFRTFYQLLRKNLPDPTCYVYLQTDIDQLNQNIMSRNRTIEQDISPKYLEKISAAYRNTLFSNNPVPILIIPYSREQWQELDDLVRLVQSKASQLKNQPGIFTL